MKGHRGIPARKAAGFTLMELLVTIAVIAILAALLLVGIGAAWRKVHQVKCVGNLRQLVTCALIYAQDNNGRPPGRRHPAYPDGDWMGTLRDYYKADKVRVCPTAPLRDPNRPPQIQNGQGSADKAWVRWTSDRRTMFFGSYAYNGWFFDSNDPRDGFGAFWLENEMRVNSSATTPIFSDANWGSAWPHVEHRPYFNLYTGQPLEVRPNSMARLIISRHGISPRRAPRKITAGEKLPGAINLGMYDGHVELARLETLWNFTWHRGWTPPAKRPDPITN